MPVPSRGHPLETMRTRAPKETTHNPHVIWVAGHRPPTGRKQFRSLFGSHILEICGCSIVRSVPMWRSASHTRTLGITSISELILFIVRCPEDVIPKEINSKDHGAPGISKILRVKDEVTRLQ